MTLKRWWLLVLCVPAFAEACSSEGKAFNGGANVLFAACHCKQLKPAKAVEIASAFGITVKGDTAWSETADGQEWHKCILVFEYADRAAKKAANCAAALNDFKAKIAAEPELSNFARNFSFVGCQS